jgi:TolA-binding protein
MMTKRLWMRAGVALAALMVQVAPAYAQDAASQETRLRKVEGEVRALQRQVFPGGDAKMFPQDAAPASAPVVAPVATPLTDVLTRMDALEAQNARLTAQVEDLLNWKRMQEAAKAAAEAPKAMVADNPPAPAPAPVAAPVVQAVPKPKPVVAPVAPVAKPAPERVAGVKAVIKPQTADTAEDEYSYGFKLWEAKYYPEAEQQLKLYLDKYPNHKSASRARNLLGRAYLDEGKAREAAPWFLQNYQADKKGERAADSLLNLAEAMVDMKDSTRACIALGEFADGYPKEAAGRLRGAFAQTRARVKCN